MSHSIIRDSRFDCVCVYATRPQHTLALEPASISWCTFSSDEDGDVTPFLIPGIALTSSGLLGFALWAYILLAPNALQYPGFTLHSSTLGARSDAIRGGQMQGAQTCYLLRNLLANVVVVLLILPLDSL